MSLPSVQLGCGGSGGHGSALRGGRVAVPLATGGQQGDQPTNWRAPTQETALTTGIPTRCAWYGGVVTGARSSGVAEMPGLWSSHKAGTSPAGDRPKERRAPSLGLEGTNPRTGRRFFKKKTRSGSTT